MIALRSDFIWEDLILKNPFIFVPSGLTMFGIAKMATMVTTDAKPMATYFHRRAWTVIFAFSG